MSFKPVKCKQLVPTLCNMARATNDSNDICYIFGGTKSNSEPYSNELWELKDDADGFHFTSINCQNPPRARAEPAMIFYKNSLILFGGRSSGKFYDKQFYICDLKNKIWKPLIISGTIPPPRSSYCFIRYGDYAIVFGGMDWANDRWNWLNDLYLIDLIQFHSIKIEISLKEFEFNGLTDFGYCIVRDELVIVGGLDGGNRYNMMFSVNVNDLILSKKINIKRFEIFTDKISCHQICPFGDNIIVFGGRTVKRKYTHDNMIIRNVLTDKVKIEKNVLNHLPSKRALHALFVLNDKLFVFGGTVEVKKRQWEYYNDIYRTISQKEYEILITYLYRITMNGIIYLDIKETISKYVVIL